MLKYLLSSAEDVAFFSQQRYRKKRPLMPASSKTDSLLAKAEAVHDGVSTSVIPYLREAKQNKQTIAAGREG